MQAEGDQAVTGDAALPAEIVRLRACLAPVGQSTDAELLHGVLAASGDCIEVLAPDGSLLFMNESGLASMEVSDFAAIRDRSWASLWPKEARAQAEAAVATALAGGTGHVLAPCDSLAGTRKIWDARVTPIRDADGRPERLLAVSRDITAIRHIEDALREAQGLNTSILASSRDFIVVMDLDARFQYVSPGGIEGMEIADVRAILGQSWLRLWHGADNDAARAAVEQARDGGTGRFQGFCPTQKGTPKWWDVAISPLPGADGRPERVLAIGRDITERMQPEARHAFLLLLADRLRTLAEPQAIIDAAVTLLGRHLGANRVGYGQMLDDGATLRLDTGYADGVAPITCSFALDAFGGHYADRHRAGQTVAVADVAADSTCDTSAWDGIETRAFVSVPLIRHGRLASTLYVSRRAPYAWSIEDVALIEDVAARIWDAIERARSEAARRDAERRLRDLNETLEQRVEERTRERDRLWELSEDMLVVSTYDGRRLRVSPSWTHVLGYDTATLLARPYTEITHPEDVPRVMKAVREMRDTGRPVSLENRLRAADGTWHWVAWRLSPEPGGERMTGTGRDITAAKAREAELEAAQEALRQSQKMEAVGQLTGGLAHDFNNLLTGIGGSLELMQSRLAQGRIGELERYITAAQGASRRAAALTHRLLAFSRRQTLDPRPTDVNRLIADLAELVGRTVGPSVTLEVVAAVGLWTTLIDPHQLENALLNLCINARDAMPDGGKLTLETANRWLDAKAARERDLPAGQYVSLCVSDTGTGMTEDVRKRAFDPFFTTKPLGQGTGLGLSMIYGFVRQSGGQVRIYSEVGQGTTVCLYLPRHGGTDEPAAPPPKPQSAPRAGRGETVLVVDDEPTVRMLVSDVLEGLGYIPIEAADGAAGLAVLRSPARVDLLVSDVGLPGGMNGRQLADAGRALRPALKVLFITGYAENAAIGPGRLEPGMHVLTKPFTMDVLSQRIRNLIGAAPGLPGGGGRAAPQAFSADDEE